MTYSKADRCRALLLGPWCYATVRSSLAILLMLLMPLVWCGGNALWSVERIIKHGPWMRYTPAGLQVEVEIRQAISGVDLAQALLTAPDDPQWQAVLPQQLPFKRPFREESLLLRYPAVPLDDLPRDGGLRGRDLVCAIRFTGATATATEWFWFSLSLAPPALVPRVRISLSPVVSHIRQLVILPRCLNRQIWCCYSIKLLAISARVDGNTKSRSPW